ncbi:(2Fe-2S)-binding protein [Thalassospira sp.]|uniref:(2Fe-2S)-binding protein n=1 Tax=Thalassospira sp. TaxID=1912094 RepID=UPI002734A0A4|nr:(2Fe-2S)-binding protein [Thalassospira sp.]MDP2699775.1 (2Fe-2S)-binding protein [Thalassospira sp.]
MFKRVQTDISNPVSIEFEGQKIDVEQGETVAAALMLAGKRKFQESAVSHAGRGPFCLMGVCFECLVEINGTPNRQACMILAEDGMKIRIQKAAIEETDR